MKVFDWLYTLKKRPSFFQLKQSWPDCQHSGTNPDTFFLTEHDRTRQTTTKTKSPTAVLTLEASIQIPPSIRTHPVLINPPVYAHWETQECSIQQSSLLLRLDVFIPSRKTRERYILLSMISQFLRHFEGSEVKWSGYPRQHTRWSGSFDRGAKESSLFRGIIGFASCSCAGVSGKAM